MPMIHLLPRLKRHAETHGITLNHLALLSTVENTPRTHTDIARLLGSTQAAVTGMVQRLVAAGCVASIPSEADTRCKYVQLTPRGQIILHAVPAALQAV